jgi:PrtD family type I secretion system ABC transporter
LFKFIISGLEFIKGQKIGTNQYVIPIIGISLINNIFMLAPSIYMLQVYDRVLSSYNLWTLFSLTLILTFVLCLNAFLDKVKISIANYASEKIEEKLSNDVHLKYHSTEAVKQPVTKILENVQTIKKFFSSYFIYIVDIPWIPIFILVAFLFNFWLGLFSSCCVVILFFLNLFNYKISTGKSKDLFDQKDIQLKKIDETSRFFEIIHSFNMSKRLYEEWKNLADHVRKLETRYSELNTFFISLSKFLRIYFQSIVLALGAVLAINSLISPGMLIAGAIILGRALAPLDQMVRMKAYIHKSEKARDQLHQLFSSSKPQKKKIEVDVLNPTIELKNVTFAKKNLPAKKIINNLSLQFKSSKTILILGPSGAGKTSLMRLLAGVENKFTGKITIDGYKMEDLAHPSDLFSYVPQDVHLLSGSVSENITSFQKDIDDQDVIKAAQKAGAHEFIQKLDNGYHYQLGSYGSGLSGGERQKITIARALFKDSPIYLFDEPTSNLDELSQIHFAKTIQALKKMKKTIILASHSKELIPLADEILVLVAGKIQMFDTRDNVLDKIMVKRSK